MEYLWVGVVGYSSGRFDEAKALENLADAYDRVAEENPGSDITIVSGLTNVGVPKLAYEEARRRGWRTVGIACGKAKDYELFPVDEKHIIGEEWGDESPTFVRSLDMLIRVGGGKQSMAETAQVREMGKPVYEYELPRIE